MTAGKTVTSGDNACAPTRRCGMALMQSDIGASGAGPMSIAAIRGAVMAARKGVARLTDH